MFNFFKNKSDLDHSLKHKLAKSRQKLGQGIATILRGKKQIDETLLAELEALLLGADVGINTTDKILQSLQKNAKLGTLKDQDYLYQLLKIELAKLLPEDSHLKIKNTQPFVILVVGVNGAGKTTTIGKIAKVLKNQGKSVLLAAGDTFRAGAISQLKIWGERNKIKVIAQESGADAAAVVFDALQSATAQKTDVLIIDTAGRLHTQSNLMQELAKIKRIIKKQNPDAPHETMLVLDGSGGQNAINQAREFHKALDLSSLSITKLDGTAKGGAVFAISTELKLPIHFIGIGEAESDLKPFVGADFIDAMF